MFVEDPLYERHELAPPRFHLQDDWPRGGNCCKQAWVLNKDAREEVLVGCGYRQGAEFLVRVLD
jgi:hypothetical protein